MQRKPLLHTFIFCALLSAVTFSYGCGVSQEKNTLETVTKHIKALSSDDMKGRDAFSEDIKLAEKYITDQMKEAGLIEFDKFPGFRHSFNIYQNKVDIEHSFIKINGKSVDDIAFSSNKSEELDGLTLKNLKDTFEVHTFSDTRSIRRDIQRIMRNDKNSWIWVEESSIDMVKRYKNYFNRGITSETKSDNQRIFVLAVRPKETVKKIDIKLVVENKEIELTNTIGYLPGIDQSRKDEYIVFGSHHDHLGVRESVAGDDKIFNGADDDASGVTAVLALAKYYSEIKTNKRSLVFMTFTAEEKGGFGSTRMLKDIPFTPEQVIAMVNIEMIGKNSKWGAGKAFLTGFERSDLGKIYQNSIADTTEFYVYPDPYPSQNLFFRSDNASFAQAGIPAHTFSTDMIDKDPHYHAPSDEFETINLQHMVKIIEGIAEAARTIVAGERTPTRLPVIK